MSSDIIEYSACLFYGEPLVFLYDETSQKHNPLKTFKDFDSEFFYSNYADGLEIILQDNVSERGKKYLAIKDSIYYANYEFDVSVKSRNSFVELEWTNKIYSFCKKNGLFYYNPTWHLLLITI